VAVLMERKRRKWQERMLGGTGGVVRVEAKKKKMGGGTQVARGGKEGKGILIVRKMRKLGRKLERVQWGGETEKGKNKGNIKGVILGRGWQGVGGKGGGFFGGLFYKGKGKKGRKV